MKLDQNPNLARIMQAVKKLHPEVGDYIGHVPTTEFTYSVKLSNNTRATITQEMEQDFQASGKLDKDALESIYHSIDEIKK